MAQYSISESLNSAASLRSDQFNDDVFTKIAEKGYVGFSDFYKERIEPIANAFEEPRLNALKKTSFRKPIGIIIWLLLTVSNLWFIVASYDDSDRDYYKVVIVAAVCFPFRDVFLLG